MPQRILASLKSLVNKRKYLIELQFSLHKCPKPSWQGFRPPQNQANAHLIFSKKVPQAIQARVETPPPLRAMPQCPQHEFEGGFPKQGHGINLMEVTGFGKTYRTDCETGRGLGEVLRSQNHERIKISTSCCGCCWIYNIA